MSAVQESEAAPKTANLRYRRNRGWEEMPKMCELPLPGGDVVFVNPLNVLYVRDQGASITSIHFTDKQTLAVDVPVATTVRLLDTAMNVDH